MRSEPFYGQNTIGTGQAVQITSSNERLERGLLIKSNENNNGIIYIGFNSSVSTGNGYPLASGAELVIPIIDPAKVYAISNTTGNDLRFIAM